MSDTLYDVYYNGKYMGTVIDTFRYQYIELLNLQYNIVDVEFRLVCIKDGKRC